MKLHRFVAILALIPVSTALADEATSAPDVTVVVLGDSITKGERAGVSADETFGAIVQRGLIEKGVKARVVNMGIGGERTDQALRRLDAVAQQGPRVVTIMYGTNDSYVDQGATRSRITVDQYRQNLKQIVSGLMRRGIEPVLMTEPRWASDASPDGSGENPNVRLGPFMEACRAVASEFQIPLVDHFARWKGLEGKGRSLRALTTDGCHPNPQGHLELASAITPVLLASLATRQPTATRDALVTGKPVKVVCLGDSVTGVYYHTGGRRAYPEMLGLALRRLYPKGDVSVINAGVSGNTTVDALARLDRDVLARKPTLVTIMFGLNDMTRVPVGDYRKNLEGIVERCRAVGAEVVLATPNNVITTQGRPTDTLRVYREAMRDVARKLDVPLCDTYADLEAIRDRDALGWRKLMSDEIHPNMDGHKRMAESLAQAITGRAVSLADVPPPAPALPHLRAKLKGGGPIKVLAMPPYDALVGPALKADDPGAEFQITSWPIEGKSLAEIEADAKVRVRAMAPDLVVLAIPRSSRSDSLEALIHDYAWAMNWSLSFGLAEWDVLVAHPSVAQPAEAMTPKDDDLVRDLVRAQDLHLIDRRPDDASEAALIFREALRALLAR